MLIKQKHATCRSLCFMIAVTVSVIGLASTTRAKTTGFSSPLPPIAFFSRMEPFQKTIPYSVFAYDLGAYSQSELVFNWLEFSFPDYLSPSNQQTQQHASGVVFRYYSGTNSYLGAYENILYYLDNQMVLYSLGDVSDWAQIAENDIPYHFYQKFSLTLSNVFWGDFHAHTSYSKDAADCAAESPSGALEFARDADKANLDFATLNDHAEFVNMAALPSQDADLWQSNLRISAEYNNENPSEGKVFIVFPGWEYTNTKGVPGCTESTGYGHKNVVFKSLTDVADFRIGACSMPPGRKAVNAQELWSDLSGFRPQPGSNEPKAFTFIHTPAHLGPDQGTTATNHITDWNVMDTDFTRHAEILSKWGNSEGPQPTSANCPQEDVPIENEDAEILVANTLRNILYQKWIIEGNSLYLFAFIGGTDNHKGHPGSWLEDDCDPSMHYLGGLTGIAAATLTRDSLWSSLSTRHTQASSTGTKIPLLLSVTAGGQILLMGDKLPFNGGTVRVRALSSDNVERIDIIIDGCLAANAAGSQIDGSFDLAAGRHFIYARARLPVQGQGRVYQAWTSPVYLGNATH
jgi:hypothetical protein